MPNSKPLTFFLNQFHMFGPNVLGYWVKAGDYTLLSGYKPSFFYWLPIAWGIIYLLAKYHNKRAPSMAPLLALAGFFISLAIAYGLTRIVHTPFHKRFLPLVLIFAVAFIYELVVLSWKIKLYIEDIAEREKTMLVLACLIASYLFFNYIFTGPVTRYLLPIIPSILLLVLAILGAVRRYSTIVAITLVLIGYMACPFSQSWKFAATFKQMDPRSSVALYIKAHPGRYYDMDVSHSIGTHLESYGVAGRVMPAFQQGCGGVDNSDSSYAIFYGEPEPELIKSCSSISFVKQATYKRSEHIIEDSLGNIGYTIYQLMPAKTQM